MSFILLLGLIVAMVFAIPWYVFAAAMSPMAFDAVSTNIFTFKSLISWYVVLSIWCLPLFFLVSQILGWRWYVNGLYGKAILGTLIPLILPYIPYLLTLVAYSLWGFATSYLI